MLAYDVAVFNVNPMKESATAMFALYLVSMDPSDSLISTGGNILKLVTNISSK